MARYGEEDGLPVEGRPPAEVEIDEALVRRLLEEQHPDLAGLALHETASGWDNAIFRLGEALSVRLPRRRVAAALVEHERRWLPGLAARLPLAVPAPLRSGGPGCGYPWSWSVCPWFPGEAAAVTEPADPFAAAATLGGFVAALHRPAPPDAPVNPYRGVPLAQRSATFHDRLRRLEGVDGLVDGPRVSALWAELAEVPGWSGPPLWLHGDLHPVNVLVDAGRISAVIDFGDLTAGDPAGDLAIAWMLFPPAARVEFRRAAGSPDDATWARARGWALLFSLAYLAHSADDPVLEQVGHRTLAELLADAS